MRNRIGLTALLAGVLIGLTAPSAHSDDAAITGVGGTISMMSGHPSIRMVSEIVKIQLPAAKVSALFVFRNDGPATWVTMGFPEQSTDFQESRGQTPLTTMQDFQSSVDGKLVTVTRRQNSVPSSLEAGSYTVWWTKRIHFAAGQTRKVHDTYTGGLAYLDPDGNVGFHYILKSGVSWHGPIGNATIICDISDLKNHGPLYFQPADGKRSDSEIRWVYTDIKPTQDIVLAWVNPFSAVSVNGQPVWRAANHGLSNYSTPDHPDMELDPFQFSWPADKWGGLGAMRVGDDIIVSAKTASAWLGAKMAIGKNGTVSEFSRPGVHVLINSNHGSLIAWGGGKTFSDRIGLSPKPLVEYAQYFNGDSWPELHGYTAIYLRKLVTALGGTSKWDRRLNRLFIQFPQAVVTAPVPQIDISVIPVPAPTVTPTPTVTHHTVGM